MVCYIFYQGLSDGIKIYALFQGELWLLVSKILIHFSSAWHPLLPVV